MSESVENVAQRDRSPAYPNIPLGIALERLAQVDAHFKRSAARPEKIGDAWGIKAKAYADRVAAALRYFGLLEYQGAGKDRQIVVSESGRKYLRAQQEEIKREVIRHAALRPKSIAKFWNEWGSDRPADAACLDELVLKNGFSEAGARDFLKVYDATITYAGLTDSDKNEQEEAGLGDQNAGDDGNEAENSSQNQSVKPPVQKRKASIVDGERELITGLLSKNSSFRLVVSGEVGVKEIERLIAKLELDKEILADPDGEEEGE